MAGERRFHPEMLDMLEGEQRQLRQPPGPLVELVAELAPNRVLDIGVGVGFFAIPLVQHLPGLRVIGLDVEPKMLSELGDRLAAMDSGADRITPLLATADAGAPYPIEAGSVDVALAINLVHELDDRPAFLAEVRRVLTPGGQLVICDWDPEGRTDFGPPVAHRLPAASVQAELEAAGLAPVDRRALYADLYTLLGRSPLT